MDSLLDQTAPRRARQLGLAMVIGLALIVGQTTAGTAEPPADGALRVSVDSQPDYATMTTLLTVRLAKSPGSEDLDITLTKAELTVGTDTTTDPGFTPTHLGPG